jgi:hypothetical protein
MKTNPANDFSALMHKRICWADEREVRLMSRLWGDDIPSRISVNVDLGTLIEMVVFSPFTPPGMADGYEKGYVRKLGYTFPIERSGARVVPDVYSVRV